MTVSWVEVAGDRRNDVTRRAPGRPAPGLRFTSARDVLALQRLGGNGAVAGYLAAGRVVQRYQPVRTDSAKTEEYAIRPRVAKGEAAAESEANMGWIHLGTRDRTTIEKSASSKYREEHTEEKLLRLAEREIGPDLKTEPTSASALRVRSLYTERKPCDSRSADMDRRGRPPGSCHALLTNALPDAVRVFYSVDGPAEHEILRRKARIAAIRRDEDRKMADAKAEKRRTTPWPPELAEIHLAAVTKLYEAMDLTSGFHYRNHVATLKRLGDETVARIRDWTPERPESRAEAGPPGRE